MSSDFLTKTPTGWPATKTIYGIAYADVHTVYIVGIY